MSLGVFLSLNCDCAHSIVNRYLTNLPEREDETRCRSLIVVGSQPMNAFIYPDEITPLHPVRNKKLLNQLVADTLKNGWQGPRLLVIKRESDYLAWTGSDRIAAAKIAELDQVPCYVLPEGELKVLTQSGGMSRIANDWRFSKKSETQWQSR